MTEPLVFEVPLPPRALSPNGRAHWAPKGAATAQYKADSQRCALNASRRADWRIPPRVRLSVEFQTGKGPRPKDGLYRPTDEDNAWACFKAGLDGMKGVLFADDNANVLELGAVTIDRKAGPGVKVTVEALEGTRNG